MVKLVNSITRQAICINHHDSIHLSIFKKLKPDPKVAELYLKGNSLRDIAKQLFIPKTTVRDMLLHLHIPLRTIVQESYRASQCQIGKKNVKPPYGFAYFEGRVVKHPKEYPHLLQIISLWKKGQSLNSIATKLNELKVPSPLSKKWSWNSIDNIIRRIKNGHLVQNGDSYELR